MQIFFCNIGVYAGGKMIKNTESLIKQLPEPFNFYRLVVEGDHLHFGFWPEENPDLTFEEAQEAMFKELLGHFPDPPSTVLDVGCGLGLATAYLAQKGYDVTGIAPSKELIDYASKKFGRSNAQFLVADFLDDNDSAYLSKLYDVVLLQESLQYLSPLDDVFGKIRRLLNPEGLVIIVDEICYDPSIKTETAVHLRGDVMTAFFGNGFIIRVDKEIGQNVLRTCDEVLKKLSDHFDEIVLSVDKADGADRLEYFVNGWKRQKRWHGDRKLGYRMIVGTKDNIIIKPYRDGDEARILPVFNEIFNVDRTMEHWYWKFRDNPFGTLKIAEAITEEGDLAAHYSGYPVPFYSSVNEPGEFLAYQIGDTMTSPEFRGNLRGNLALGEASVLYRVTKFFYYKFCIGETPFNYGYNTGKIKKIGERYLQYEYCSPVPYHVLDLKEKPPKRPSRIRKLLSGFSIERVSGVDREYDLFFEKTCHDYGILVKRTSSYLKWRYLECPDNVHDFFAVRRFGKLVGWSVFSTRGDILIWGDALFSRKCPNAVNFMLADLLNQFYPDVARVEGWFSQAVPWWNSVLRGAGFEVTTEPNNLSPGFAIFDRRFSTELFERSLYYTAGDSDLF